MQGRSLLWMLHHPRLSFLLELEDRAALAALSPAELWKLERKCDVDLEAIYGEGTFTLDARLPLIRKDLGVDLLARHA